MNIVCSTCSTKIKIPSNKVPKDKSFSINCPKCKAKITIDQESKRESRPETPVKNSSPNDAEHDSRFISDMASEPDQKPENPFDFLEEGAETALICELDGMIRRKIKAYLEKSNYHISEPDSAREALKQIRFHDYDLIIINELFGTRDPESNHILKYLSQLRMNTRRNIFVVMLTERFRSMDKMTAYNRSVNLVINLKDIDHVDKILQQGITDNAAFYRIFKDISAKLGRI